MEGENIINFKVKIILGALSKWYIPIQNIVIFGSTFLLGETAMLSEPINGRIDNKIFLIKVVWYGQTALYEQLSKKKHFHLVKACFIRNMFLFLKYVFTIS